MKVCICGSFKFWMEMREIEALLIANGIECLLPEPSKYRDPKDPSRFIKDLPVKEELVLEAGRVTLRHFAKIDKADLVLVVNPKGYAGTSTILEIGYAWGRGKPVYALEEFEDPALQSRVNKIVTTEGLVEMIRREHSEAVPA